ncbi:MAG: PEGA domain-containing protein [Candidatus Daviesbacteria bacterium]|nr:PEGA domain-containing protein [Candidatus Daviesbacteria bacterium]
MKRSAYLILIVLSLLALFLRFMGPTLVSKFGQGAKAGIKVTSIPEAEVSLNGEYLGKTPYSNENLLEGEYSIELTTKSASWSSRINLHSGTVTLVNREINQGLASSSGEVLTLNPGSGVTLTSNPTGTLVEVDGQLRGLTPLTLTDLKSESEYTFSVSKQGFLKRSIRARLPSSTKLLINVDLAITELIVPTPQPIEVSSNSRLIVSRTPVGFLRMRDRPSTLGKELVKLKPEEEVVLIEDLGAWLKVRNSEGLEGYVSSLYVRKGT